MKNNDTSEKQVYGVTGMPLAGKTTVAKIMEAQGLEVIDMGDVVRKEIEKRDIPVEKTGEWVNNQRKKKGMDAIAQLTAPYIEGTESEKIVITGMRGLDEKKRFEKELSQEMKVIAVWASPETREKRRKERMREEDLKGDSFRERDLRELENGVGKLMALSDYSITNETDSMKELKQKVKEIVK